MNFHTIFILGASHSGTTILYRMIAMHPDLAYFSQYSQRDGIIPDRFYFPLNNLVNRTLGNLLTHDWHKRKHFWNYIVPRPGEAHRIWNYMLPPDEKRTCLGKRRIVQRLQTIVTKELKEWKKERIVFKLPRLSRSLPVLFEAFPNAKGIHIVRDGRAVSFSNLHKFLRNESNQQKALRASAAYWREMVSYVAEQRKRLGKSQIFVLRYEDFCKDIHGYLQRLLNFTDLHKGTFPFKKLPKELESTNPKWLNAAAETDLQIIYDEAGEMLTCYGYTEDNSKIG